MATKKGSSIKWLSIHVLVYTLTMFIGFGIYLLFTEVRADDLYEKYIIFTVLNGVLHWGTDFLTSKGTTYFYKKENMYGFFGTVGLDQLIHASTLLLTYNYLFIK